MNRVALFNSVSRVLCIGAHCDDIDIGAGGAVLSMLAANPAIEITWAVFSGNATRHAEQQAAFERFCAGAAGRELVLHGFRDGYFPSELPRIKDEFEKLKAFRPDLVLTHTRFDRHQDHRTLSDLTWNTFRSHLVLEFEIPKWDGEAIEPNVFVPLEADVLDRKLAILRESFASQRDKQWFDDELFRGKARLRGIEANTRYAEAFVARKLVIQ